MRDDIRPGATLPDYRLPDHTGRQRRLSELQAGDPLALVLARGGYCPKDHWQHVLMARMEPEVHVGYCRIVTISTDPVLESREWRARLGVRWPFLSDEERIVQKDLEIQEYTDPVHDPMIPHTIMLEPGLVIHRIYNGYWYFGRPTPEELRRDFREMSREARPDWDLSRPGLRERWEHGDRAAFWPYTSGRPTPRAMTGSAAE